MDKQKFAEGLATLRERAEKLEPTLAQKKAQAKKDLEEFKPQLEELLKAGLGRKEIEEVMEKSGAGLPKRWLSLLFPPAKKKTKK